MISQVQFETYQEIQWYDLQLIVTYNQVEMQTLVCKECTIAVNFTLYVYRLQGNLILYNYDKLHLYSNLFNETLMQTNTFM